MLSTQPKPFVFVVMPFAKEFDDVYQLGIKQACEKAGMYCERIDEQLYAERILDRIYNQIAKADVIVADMTGRNENVFYEVGYAHGLGKKVILLTDDANDIPFDLKDYPHIVYAGRIVDLLEPLTKKLKWSITLPDTTKNASACPIELFFNETKLLLDEVTHFKLGRNRAFKVSFHNLSSIKLSKRQLRIGIVTNRTNFELRNCVFDNSFEVETSFSHRKVIHQPDNSNLVVVNYKDEIYQDEWGTFTPVNGVNDKEEFTIKLILPTGTFCFPVSCEVENFDQFQL
jgi:hypothetical protein